MLSSRFCNIALVSIGFAITIPDTASADNHLNCQAYAQSVINLANENARFGCGFTGQAWSTDYNMHLNWCNSQQMADLTREDKNRKKALHQCKLTKPGSGVRPANAYSEKECHNYAKQMVGNTQTNITRGCGINDPRMHLNYQAHFDWCFNGRTKQVVRATLNEVIASIKQCHTAQNTKTFKPTIGFTPDDGQKRQVAYNYCDRLIGADKKCGKPVADLICKVKGFAKSTAHKKGTWTHMNDVVTSYFIGTKQAGKGVSQIFNSVTCVR